jgi:hypothetical protein
LLLQHTWHPAVLATTDIRRVCPDIHREAHGQPSSPRRMPVGSTNKVAPGVCLVTTTYSRAVDWCIHAYRIYRYIKHYWSVIWQLPTKPFMRTCSMAPLIDVIIVCNFSICFSAGNFGGLNLKPPSSVIPHHLMLACRHQGKRHLKKARD